VGQPGQLAHRLLSPDVRRYDPSAVTAQASPATAVAAMADRRTGYSAGWS
jgi:hypothetical protein